MKSVNFEEATNKIAENQPEFKTVHSQFQSSDQSINLCFELDDDEIETIRKEKRIWYKQVIGKENMQPILLSTNKWEIIEDPINNINDNSDEGSLLLSALAILTTDNFPNNTPQEVLNMLKAKAEAIKTKL